MDRVQMLVEETAMNPLDPPELAWVENRRPGRLLSFLGAC
jgi:hypothetical protein